MAISGLQFNFDKGLFMIRFIALFLLSDPILTDLGHSFELTYNFAK